MGLAIMFNHCRYGHGQMALAVRKIKIYLITNNSKTS